MHRVVSSLSPEVRIFAGLLLVGVCGVLTLLAIDAGSAGRSTVSFWVSAFALGYPGLVLTAWGLVGLATGAQGSARN